MSYNNEFEFDYDYVFRNSTFVQIPEMDEIPKCVVPGTGDDTIFLESAFQETYSTTCGLLEIIQEQKLAVGGSSVSSSLHLPASPSASSESWLYHEHSGISLFPPLGEPKQPHNPPLSPALEAGSTAEKVLEKSPDGQHHGEEDDQMSGSTAQANETGTPTAFANHEQEDISEYTKVQESENRDPHGHEDVTSERIRQQQDVEDEGWIFCEAVD